MIVKYRTRFNDSLLPELVKESECEFADGCINSPEKVVDMMRRIFFPSTEKQKNTCTRFVSMQRAVCWLCLKRLMEQ